MRKIIEILYSNWSPPQKSLKYKSTTQNTQRVKTPIVSVNTSRKVIDRKPDNQAHSSFKDEISNNSRGRHPVTETERRRETITAVESSRAHELAVFFADFRYFSQNQKW